MPSADLASHVFELVRGCLNPSSLHRPGQRARALVEEAREVVRSFVGAERKDKIIFTSGATEANSLALYGALAARQSISAKLGRVISTMIEHHSVLEVLQELSGRGTKVELVSPAAAAISSDQFASKLSEDVALLSVMAANNETGLVLPVAEIARLARENLPKVLVHSDAVQIFGRLRCSISALNADMLTISGHKLGAFSGVGCLVAREHVPLLPQLRGGPQEGRLRAGTENLIGIVSMSEAIKQIAPTIEQRGQAMLELREHLWSSLSRQCKIAKRLFSQSETLPNTLSVQFPGIRSDDLLVALDLKGISVSAGSACASGRPDPSHVLLAHGFSNQEAREVIRISLSGSEELAQLEIAAREIATLASFNSSKNINCKGAE